MLNCIRRRPSTAPTRETSDTAFSTMAKNHPRRFIYTAFSASFFRWLVYFHRHRVIWSNIEIFGCGGMPGTEIYRRTGQHCSHFRLLVVECEPMKILVSFSTLTQNGKSCRSNGQRRRIELGCHWLLADHNNPDLKEYGYCFPSF